MRGSHQKKKPTLSAPIEFEIVPSSITYPTIAASFDGCVKCSVIVLLDGTTKSCFIKDTPSCKTYYRYSTREYRYKQDGSLEVDVVSDFKLKDRLTREDMYCLYDEMGQGGFARRVLPSNGHSVKTADFVSQPFFQTVIAASCDMYRLPYVRFLAEFYPRKSIVRMTPDQLTKLKLKIQKTPWELVFTAITKPLLGVKGLSSDNFHKAMIQGDNLRNKIPPMINQSIEIYYKILSFRDTDKHTIFSVDFLKRIFNYPANWNECMDYLTMRRAIVVHEQHSLAIFEDYQDATTAVQALRKVAASGDPPVERNSTIVPAIPHPLTSDQQKVVNYIGSNWFTMVEGYPGTGKTLILTWVMAYYKNVMQVTFTGMMCRILQRRNNGHTEAASTMHSVVTAHKFVKNAATWLKAFDVLLIDEFSNTAMPIFARLLSILPSIKKVVVVGDGRQLPPIEPGSPMIDMQRVFGSHVLTQIMRVKEELTALATAPKLIDEGCLLDFSTPALQLAQDKDLARIYREIIKLPQGRSVAKTHIIVLTNSGPDSRAALNKKCLEVLTDLGVLNPPAQQVHLRGNLKIFPGIKLTFCKNYNKPILVGQEKYASVCNGELCIVKRIEAKHGGHVLHLVDSDVMGDDPMEKRVFIHKDNGIDPSHVELGFCSTTYKVQGNECPYVIFWVISEPGSFWTRPHLYVAISRGKERVYVAGKLDDIYHIANNRERERRTIFYELLKGSGLTVGKQTSDEYPLMLLPEEMSLMPRFMPCVPTLATTTKKESNNSE